MLPERLAQSFRCRLDAEQTEHSQLGSGYKACNELLLLPGLERVAFSPQRRNYLHRSSQCWVVRHQQAFVIVVRVLLVCPREVSEKPCDTPDQLHTLPGLLSTRAHSAER